MAKLHTVNEDYFADIDTEEKSYWLGFIAADGCVLSPRKGKAKSGTFSMSLQAGDRLHLEKFRTAIGYSGPLPFFDVKSPNNDTTSRQCRINVHRTVFCDHLIRQGCAPRKTWNLSPPTNIDSHLLRHWWRGFFDGDGTISFHDYQLVRSKKRTWVAGVMGTEDIATGFADFVRQETGVRVNIYSRRGKLKGVLGEVMWTAKVSGVQVTQAVIRLLYADATVFLERKNEMGKALLATVPKRDRSSLWVKKNRFRQQGSTNIVNTMMTVGHETHSIKAWSKQVKISDSTIHNRLKRGDSPSRSIRPVAERCTPKEFGPLTLDGVTLTIPQWSKKLRLNVTTIYFRLNHGESPEQALRPVGKVLLEGKNYSISELARLVGIKRTTLRYRLQQGQPVEEAIRAMQ